MPENVEASRRDVARRLGALSRVLNHKGISPCPGNYVSDCGNYMCKVKDKKGGQRDFFVFSIADVQQRLEDYYFGLFRYAD